MKGGANARPHGYTRKYVTNVFKWRHHFAEQARVWRYAGGLDDLGGKDSWISGATDPAIDQRVVSEGALDALGRGADRAIARIVVRRIPSGTPAARLPDGVVADWRGGLDTREGGMDERLRVARATLDDFTPHVRRRPVVRWWVN